MGATRESSWSGGIFAAWLCGEGACAGRGEGIYANVSPGTMAIVQTIISRYRKLAPETFFSDSYRPLLLIHCANCTSPSNTPAPAVSQSAHDARTAL